MKRVLNLLVMTAFAMLTTAATISRTAAKQQADTMAREAARELGLTRQEMLTLGRLFAERLDSIDRRTNGVTDPAERSLIVKATHGEFTKKLHDAYNRKMSNRIEGWYYNYMNGKK